MKTIYRSQKGKEEILGLYFMVEMLQQRTIFWLVIFCLKISIFWQLILSGTPEKVLRRIAFFRAPESLRERRRSFQIAQHTFFVAGDTCIS